MRKGLSIVAIAGISLTTLAGCVSTDDAETTCQKYQNIGQKALVTTENFNLAGADEQAQGNMESIQAEWSRMIHSAGEPELADAMDTLGAQWDILADFYAGNITPDNVNEQLLEFSNAPETQEAYGALSQHCPASPQM